jgi:hypothetical protein
MGSSAFSLSLCGKPLFRFGLAQADRLSGDLFALDDRLFSPGNPSNILALPTRQGLEGTTDASRATIDPGVISWVHAHLLFATRSISAAIARATCRFLNERVSSSAIHRARIHS